MLSASISQNRGGSDPDPWLWVDPKPAKESLMMAGN
jgi:hypothetical protein